MSDDLHDLTDPPQTEEELLASIKDLPLHVRAEVLEEARDLVNMSDDHDRLNYLQAVFETRRGWGGDEHFLEFVRYNDETKPEVAASSQLAFHSPPYELEQRESDQR